MLIPIDHDYEAMTDNLVRVLRGVEVLSGNVQGNRAWQDEATVLFQELTLLTDQVRRSRRGAGIVFPSPVELIEEGLEK